MKNCKLLSVILVVLLALTSFVGAGERLYNGIDLPDQWPPRYEKLTRDPMPVPYLDDPPEVIPIDVGRQLFVDDFLIQETTLDRRFHLPRSHPSNPVIRPDREWEHFVFPYSGGVWHDPADGLFKMWYCCRDGKGGHRWGPLCLATSRDGVSWDKPNMGDGTNIVLSVTRDSSTVWLDHDAVDSRERFKYFTTEYSGVRGDDAIWGLVYRISADGTHWSEPVAQQEIWGDRTTAFYNPFRKVWVLSQRIEGHPAGRARSYLEAPTAMELMESVTPNVCHRVNDVMVLSAEGKSVLWTGADDYDPRHPWVNSSDHAELYNLDAAPYESLMLGFFTIFQGDPHHKNLVLTGFSRDGFHWWRPDRRPFLYDERGEGWVLSRRSGSGETDVRQVTSNIQSAAGGCIVVGDELYFYAMSSANRGTNLYVLRRDGFASMDTGSNTESLTTRPVTFNGKYLFVNVDCPEGELKAEVLNEDSDVIEPFTLENCDPIATDKTLLKVEWEDGEDLADLAGKPVRFRFQLRNGSLYAFWVSPDTSGASHGYISAGGPGFTGPTDTVGKNAVKTKIHQ